MNISAKIDRVITTPHCICQALHSWHVWRMNHPPRVPSVYTCLICMLGFIRSGNYSIFRHMMTSWNGNTFRVTGSLCGEFTDDRLIPLTMASDAELWCFVWSAHEPTIDQTMETLAIWDAITLIMTSLWWENFCWLQFFLWVKNFSGLTWALRHAKLIALHFCWTLSPG